MEKLLKSLDIYVDFGNGDKFMVTLDEIDLEKKRLVLKGSQGQMRWVRIDERIEYEKSNINRS